MSELNTSLSCPFCSTPHPNPFHQDRSRDYYRCTVCQLVFVHPESYLTPPEELQRYNLHQNSLSDKGYRHFLEQLYFPMLSLLKPNSKGLDFGSGPAPLLQTMFQEAGHSVTLYDSFYARDLQVFDESYDFITATEVLEHLFRPLPELERLWGCLRPSGKLGVMTKLLTSVVDFPSWHYIQDRTHVLFFAPESMHWLSSHWGADLELISSNVIIFHKPS